MENNNEDALEIKKNEDILIDESQNIFNEENISNINEDSKSKSSQNISDTPKDVEIIGNKVSEKNNDKKHRNYFKFKEDSKKKFKIFFIIFTILIVNIFIVFGIICTLNRLNMNVYKNVYIFRSRYIKFYFGSSS
jgi:ABC-type antimicrobial peptide transport system permease subunit